MSLAPGSQLCQQNAVVHELVRDWLASGCHWCTSVTVRCVPCTSEHQAWTEFCSIPATSVAPPMRQHYALHPICLSIYPAPASNLWRIALESEKLMWGSVCHMKIMDQFWDQKSTITEPHNMDARYAYQKMSSCTIFAVTQIMHSSCMGDAISRWRGLKKKWLSFLSFFFGVAHTPLACQHWGLPHRLAQFATSGKELV